MLGTATTRVLQIPEGILHTKRFHFLHLLVSSKDQSKRLIRLVYNSLRRPLFVNNFSCNCPALAELPDRYEAEVSVEIPQGCSDDPVFGLTSSAPDIHWHN